MLFQDSKTVYKSEKKVRSPGGIAYTENVAASVLLKLFINGNARNSVNVITVVMSILYVFYLVS